MDVTRASNFPTIPKHVLTSMNVKQTSKCVRTIALTPKDHLFASVDQALRSDLTVSRARLEVCTNEDMKYSNYFTVIL